VWAVLKGSSLQTQAPGLPGITHEPCPHQLPLYGLAQYELYLHTGRQQTITVQLGKMAGLLRPSN
jgi:hypothetical protein